MQDSVDQIAQFFFEHRHIVVLTGAGISAMSGIPTYRDRDGVWRSSTPIQHQDFISRVQHRERYWYRSYAGWPAIRDARPNTCHLALTRLEAVGSVPLLVTQNVDRLHQRAGTQQVVDLHGRLDQIRCLACGDISDREIMQRRLEQMNRHWISGAHYRPQPDGDAELELSNTPVALPSCLQCDGVLMPNVVFFGGNVPKERVERTREALHQSDALLCFGTSLRVYSGFRFVKEAKRLGKPVAIITEGVTRADTLADLKVSRHAAESFVTAIDQFIDTKRRIA